MTPVFQFTGITLKPFYFLKRQMCPALERSLFSISFIYASLDWLNVYMQVCGSIELFIWNGC